MSKWTKTYTDIDNVNGGNQYEKGDHITKEAINIPLNNSEYAVQKALTLENTKVDKVTNKSLIYNYKKSDCDFNDFTQAGFYYLTTNLTNAPQTDISTAVPSYYHLCVVQAGNNECLQIASNPRSSRVFFRYHNTDNWGTWQEFQNKEAGKYLIHNDSANSAYNLNDLKTTGFYYCNTNSTNLPPNPNAHYFRVLVNGWQNNANLGTSQIAQDIGTGTMYSRVYSDGTWKPWVLLADERAYYNLGAYDTYVDNGDGTATITRQTGYDTLPTDNWWKDDYKYGYRMSRYNEFSTQNIQVDICQMGSSAAYEYQGDKIVFSQGSHSEGHWKYSIYCYNSEFDKDTFKEWLTANPIHIQYKLATSYTEQVISNRPLLDLPKQGTEWLREEWEKGLNLFDFSKLTYQSDGSLNISSFANNNGTITISWSGGGDNYAYTNESLTLEPGTYTLYYNSNNAQYICLYNREKGHQFIYKGSPLTWTITETTTYNVRFDGSENIANGTATFSNIMLTKGDGVYPYKPYNGAIIRENDIVDSLESTATNQPLSANQGRLLSEKIENIESAGVGDKLAALRDQYVGVDGQVRADGVYDTRMASQNAFDDDCTLDNQYEINIDFYKEIQSHKSSINTLQNNHLYLTTAYMSIAVGNVSNAFVVTLSYMTTKELLVDNINSSGTGWYNVYQWLVNNGYQSANSTWEKTKQVYPCNGTYKVGSTDLNVIGIRAGLSSGEFYLLYVSNGSYSTISTSQITPICRLNQVKIY